MSIGWKYIRRVFGPVFFYSFQVKKQSPAEVLFLIQRKGTVPCLWMFFSSVTLCASPFHLRRLKKQSQRSNIVLDAGIFFYDMNAWRKKQEIRSL